MSFAGRPQNLSQSPPSPFCLWHGKPQILIADGNVDFPGFWRLISNSIYAMMMMLTAEADTTNKAFARFHPMEKSANPKIQFPLRTSLKHSVGFVFTMYQHSNLFHLINVFRTLSKGGWMLQSGKRTLKLSKCNRKSQIFVGCDVCTTFALIICNFFPRMRILAICLFPQFGHKPGPWLKSSAPAYALRILFLYLNFFRS